MTNYVMLELLLTRFEDRVLFGHPGVLHFWCWMRSTPTVAAAGRMWRP